MMVASETTKCQSFVFFITATMLFGMVSCHFRVGRELYPLHQQPSPEQQLPVFRERLASRIFPEWLRRPGFKNTKTIYKNEEEILPTEGERVFNDVRPGFLKRLKAFSRVPVPPPESPNGIFRCWEEGAQEGNVKKNRVAPS